MKKKEANKLLKSADILLCIAGLYHMLKGWKENENPVNLSDIGVVLRKLSPGAESFGSCRSYALENCENQGINTIV